MPSSGGQTCALRSEEHTSELQSLTNLVCRLLLEQKADKFTLRDEFGYFVGTAQRARAYIYDGSALNHPLIADRGETAVEADIDGIRHTIDFFLTKAGPSTVNLLPINPPFRP